MVAIDAESGAEAAPRSGWLTTARRGALPRGSGRVSHRTAGCMAHSRAPPRLLLPLLLAPLALPAPSPPPPLPPLCDTATGLLKPAACCSPAAEPRCAAAGGDAKRAWDGVSLRPYCLHAPPPKDGKNGSTAPLPMVVYLHDAAGGVAQLYSRTTLAARSRSFALSPGLRGFVLALPQARGLVAPYDRRGGRCATGWDSWHRNFSTGRRCPDCRIR